MKSPIILFVFKRPEHTLKTLESLGRNVGAEDSDLFIYSDGPRNEKDMPKIQEVRKIIKKVKGFKKIRIICREENYGLANNIIDGVTEIIRIYGNAIVLEDDLISSPLFLTFMNSSLRKYIENEKIFSVSAYNFPPDLMPIPSNYNEDVYLSHRNSSWGWGTWKNRWEKVDWSMVGYKNFLRNRRLKVEFNRGGDDLTDMLKRQMRGEIDSWSIRFTYAHYVNKAYSLCPIESYINNVGHDGTGTHCKENPYLLHETLNERLAHLPDHIDPDNSILSVYRKVYKYHIYTKIALIYNKMFKQKIFKNN